jgi:hydroxymethylglutaryl-CoA lyase
LKTYGANKIIECPRDAMQGIKPFIPTRKVAYIQSLRVGFDSIDFGSLFLKAAIQQDTAAVLTIDLSQTTSKLLAIIANRGQGDFKRNC